MRRLLSKDAPKGRITLDIRLMPAYETFSELSLRNRQYKKVAVVSAVLFLAVIAVLLIELTGIKH